jgi:cytoskeletal protein CcmA (bactofilin family)
VVAVIRGIAALIVLSVVSLAWAQTAERVPDDDFRSDPSEVRQERRERIREARQERREQIETAREERRERNRERMERLRERFDGDGVHLRVFRDYTLAEGETSNEPIVVIGGSAQIDGRVDDDVVVIGGGLHLGPKAVVEGNAVSVAGGVTLDPGASVHGSIDEAVVPWPGITFDPGWTNGWWTGLAFWGSVFRLSLTMAVALFLTLAAPGWIANISDRAAGASILTGLAIEVLFVPALVVLVVALIVSIVGIPLLAAIPLLLAAFALIWVAGFTGVAVRLGRALRGRSAMAQPSVVDFLIGYAIIIGVTVIAQLMAYSLGWLSPVSWPMRSAGLLVEYVAWTIGLGAAVTSMFTTRRVVPPPVPV